MKQLISYFFKGLAVVIPIIVVIYVIDAFAGIVQNLLPRLNALEALIGALIAVTVIGALFSSRIAGAVHRLTKRMLAPFPTLAHIYTSVQSSIASVARREGAFDRPVWIAIGSEGEYRLGFMTQEDLGALGLSGYASVYMPDAFSFSGIVSAVSHERITPASIDRARAFSFASSGGMITGVAGEHSDAATTDTRDASDNRDNQ